MPATVVAVADYVQYGKASGYLAEGDEIGGQAFVQCGILRRSAGTTAARGNVESPTIRMRKSLRGWCRREGEDRQAAWRWESRTWMCGSRLTTLRLPSAADAAGPELPGGRIVVRRAPLMKPMNEKHFAILRRHMVETIGIHSDLMDDELGKATFDERVLTEMMKVPRHLFVPAPLAHVAYVDGPLPIGFDKTISQPAHLKHQYSPRLFIARLSRGHTARRPNGQTLCALASPDRYSR
jgi:hypothetical protein